jgi:hypothetical protein
LTPPLPDLVAATLAVVRVLDDLGIPYLIGGSLASSAYGEARTTQDVDLVVDLAEVQVASLVARLRPDFYADDERARQAVARRGSFNVIHLRTMSKIDLFVAGDDPPARRQLERRRTLPMPGLPDVVLSVSSPEDVIVQKLRWYRLGNEVSERQWRDAEGVARVQGAALDRTYLRKAARELEVEDLLDRLLPAD